MPRLAFIDRTATPIQLDQGNYVSLHKPLQREIIAAHIKGTITLGAYALDEKVVPVGYVWMQMKAKLGRS